MVRLPVLSRLARRHPIVLPFLADDADARETALPETPFVKHGELVLDALKQRHYWSQVKAYCSPSVHQAGLQIVAGPWFDRIQRLLESSGYGDDPLERAEEMAAVAMHCKALAADADDPLPLQVFQFNWLCFAIGAAELPQAALALHDLLKSWQVSPLAAIAVLMPGLRQLAHRLNAEGEGWQELQGWVLASHTGDATARQHFDSLVAGLKCIFEVAGLLLTNLNRHALRDVEDFVRRARHWVEMGTQVLAEAGLPWEPRDRLTQRLDRLAQWVASSADLGLPGYFGFPYSGNLPAIGTPEKLGSLYLSGDPSPFFCNERFQFDAVLRAETAPLITFFDSDPEFLQAIEAAGGERADFYQLGERCYDQLDALRAADPDAPWNEERSRIFLRALSCRALALVRDRCTQSANDLYAALKGWSNEEGQDPWVSEATALLIFAPLGAVLDEALSVEPDGQTLQVIGWINRYRSADARLQAAGRAKLQQLRFAWLNLCRLIDEGRDMLVDLAGEHEHAALQVRVGDLVEDLRALAELPEMGLILGDEGGSAQTFLGEAKRLYERACEKKSTGQTPPAKSAGATEQKGSSAKASSASAPASAAATASRLIPIVFGKVLDSPADSKYLKEQWSQSKAEQLKKGVQLLPGRPERIALLREEFPWFAEVIDFIETWLLRDAALGVLACRLPPLLLVGGVGCGKTYFARRLAEVLELPFQVLAAGGSTDNRQLAGTSRGWGTAYPSLPVDFMCGTGVGNGLLVIDEVEKESPDRRNGRMTDTLLQLLEPANARHFNDPFLGAAVDCSHLQWALTANSLKGVHEALLSRVRLFAVQQPGRDHYPRLAQQIRLGFAKEHHVDHRLLPALDGDDLEMIRNLCKSVRQVRQVTEWLLTKRILEEQRQAQTH